MPRENALINPNKPKPKKCRKDEAELREIIAPLQFTHTQKAIAEIATKKMGKAVQARRVSAVLHKMKEEHENDFNRSFMSSRVAAYESHTTYRRLEDEGFKLLDESYRIEEVLLKANEEYEELPDGTRVPTGKTSSKGQAKAMEKAMNLKLMALDKIRMARESIDKLMKMAGVHREAAPKDNEEQIQDLLKAMNIYLKYVVRCPECEHVGSDVQQFIEFIEMVGKDPSALDAFMTSGTGVSKKGGIDDKYFQEARQIIDAEAKDVKEE
jgi:hypothetical protein